jgi:hypothetical protein
VFGIHKITTIRWYYEIITSLANKQVLQENEFFKRENVFEN